MRCVLLFIAAVLFGVLASSTGLKAFELTEVARIPLHAPTWAIAWSEDGSRLAGLVGNDVETWNAASWAQEAKFPALHRAHAGQSLAYASGGILVGAPDQIAPYNGPADAFVPGVALVLWDPATGSSLRRFPDPDLHSAFGSMRAEDTFAVSLDGRQIAATDASPFEPLVFIYDTATGAILHAVPLPPVPRPPPQFEPIPEPNPTIQEIVSALAYSPVGNMVAACGYSGRVYLLDATAGTVVRAFSAYSEGVRCSVVAFSIDGKLLATGRESRQYVRLGHQLRPGERMTLEPDTGNVRVWDAVSGRMMASFLNAVGTTRALSWSRSGSTLIAGDDGTLHEFEFNGATVSEIASLTVPGGVSGASFSPDDRLAVLGNDMSIAVYR